MYSESEPSSLLDAMSINHVMANVVNPGLKTQTSDALRRVLLLDVRTRDNMNKGTYEKN